MSNGDDSIAHSFATLLDTLREGFQIIGFDFRYLYVNAAAAKHGRRGREHLLGRTMMQCYPGIEQTEVFALMRQSLEQRTSHVFENDFRYPDGSLGCFELRIEPVPQGICVLSIDVSGRKTAEANLKITEDRLRHAERMEAVGMLAAGIAHDFNNLLSVILGYGELALTRSSGPQVEDVQGIMAAARRSADLTRQLLAYGRRQVMRSEIIDPTALLTDLATMLTRTLAPDVDLTVVTTPPIGHVEVDPSKLEQVVMNLVLNARDAMPRGGKITVGIDEVELAPDELACHPGLKHGPHIVISVSDTGFGMDTQTQAHIFEPFFTTKAKGKGTGLGLATVYGIVKQSGGDISVYSEPGCGSTFKVFLPRSKHSLSRRPSKPESGSIALPTPIEDVTVLVAEDDAILSAIAEECLIAAGYRVLLAASGDEALRLCDSQRAISLLVTDVAMPGLRGPELIAAARRIRPELKVLCTSGYALAALKDQHVPLEEVAFLEKPYLPSALVGAVRALTE